MDVSIDLETYSSVDIKSAGMYKYVQSPDFEVLLLAYSVDGAPVTVIDLAQGQLPPDDLCRMLLTDPEVTLHAYNAAFEWYCLSKYFGIDPVRFLDRWECTMIHGLYCGLTTGLDATGKALGLPADKQKMAEGKRLIGYFCKPCKPTKSNGGRTRNLPKHAPEKWDTFVEYNRQDVVTEMEIEHRLSEFPVPSAVWDEWRRDMRSNLRGVAVDFGLIHGALYCNDRAMEQLRTEAAELTGLSNPNSTAQLKPWLEAQIGEPIDNLQKQTVSDLLDGVLPEKARRMLEIRRDSSKTSVKKYQAMVESACEDGRVRGLLQFYGANRTGRWAGRIVQVQNLPRMSLHGEEVDTARRLVKSCDVDDIEERFGSVPSLLSQLIRTAFVPKSGCRFVDADFSAIEARVISWLAGEEWRMEVFRTHGKIYEASASAMFGVPMERIAKGNPEYELRQKGKVSELALGYQGGTGALVQMGALRMGIPEEELPRLVKLWRKSNPRIVRLWQLVERAALTVIDTRSGSQGVRVRNLLDFRQERSKSGLRYLTIRLPSGRKLFYADPQMTMNRFGNASIRYTGMDQKTKKWCHLETYGGKLVENIVQAIARDCLSVNLERLEAAGYDVNFHIHDEVVIEAPANTADLNAVTKIMSTPIDWAPGLCLGADGWVGDYFTKD